VAIASGLGSSLGIAAESTVGTIVSPTRWIEYNSESLSLDKAAIQGQGLRGGGLYARSARRVLVTRNAGGSVDLDVATSGMGLPFKAMLGASASAVVSGSAYQQVHTPASLYGQSLSVQKLVPNSAGTLVPFTYNGCKVTDWELSCDVGSILALALTLDAWDETTATSAGTPSYSASTSVFHFKQGVVTLGGTPSTTSGVVSVSGGSTVAVVRGASVRGSNGITTGDENQRFGTKVQQQENDWRSLGGNLDLDFVNQATVYDLFSADTATALQLTFTGTTAISGSVYPTLEVIVPSIRFDGETPQVGGPDVISTSADFTGLDDGTNAAVQIRYVTPDTSVS
jgi:hypothetical protein